MAHKHGAYKVRASKELDDNAYKTLAVTLLPDETRVVLIRFDGTCPWCQGSMSFPYPLIGFPDGVAPAKEEVLIDTADQLGLSHGDMDVELHCTCGPSHDKEQEGCGACFSIHVTWGPQ